MNAITATLITISSVTARFLMVGEIIERGDALFVVTSMPVVDELARTASVQATAYGDTRDTCEREVFTLEMPAEALVPLYSAA